MHFSIKNYWLFAQKPLPAYLFREDFKKKNLECTSRQISHFTSLSSDAGMLVTRTRWKKPKPRVKILRMELDVTSMMAFWMNLVDGLGWL